MKRREFLSTLGAVPGATALAQTAPRPNIVLILADDLGLGDLGCYGQTKIRTPHIDRMASEGMRFEQAYAGSSVCAPSRCSLLTGLHTGHCRVRDNIPHGVFLQPSDVTIAEVLKQAGYRTGGIGKWSLGNPGSWGVPTQQGFDEFFGYLNQDHAHTYYPEHLWDNGNEVLLTGNRANARKQYSPDLFLKRGLRFITENKTRPFFLYFAPTIPHWSDFARKSVMSQDVPSAAPYENEPWPEVEKKYAAMVTRLDAAVGQMLTTLKYLGLDDNTLVVFSSDNGPSAEALHSPEFFRSGGGLRGVKRDLYEGGIRAPLVARWPGRIAKATTNESVVAFWDVLPTLAEAAGLPAPGGIDGRSFAECLQGALRKSGGPLYWEYGHEREQFHQAVRRGDWKAVRRGSRNAVELYDLATDGGEQTNVAQKETKVAAEMKSLMAQLRSDSADYRIRDRAV
jgi:arylsulfatase A-like enzyme